MIDSRTTPRTSAHLPPTPVQLATQRAFDAIGRFLHIEAVSGIALLIAAVAALIWANSPFAASYHALWHTPVTLGIGELVFSRDLHFWVNDILMTVFFLVVGMEVRREMHDGALASLRTAALPMIAALGGVVCPALIFLAVNGDEPMRHGWAIPTATDIAFAVGVLAILGKSVPGSIRIMLLALAIIDDIAAVLIIALFYSGGLDAHGLVVAMGGIAAVIGLRTIGIGNAYAYVIPGALVWLGLLYTGAHPTLAGVMLGLMTPVVPMRSKEPPFAAAARAAERLLEHTRAAGSQAGGHAGDHAGNLAQPLDELQQARRTLIAPVDRIVTALHPWVAFGIMPLFALANAGVSLNETDLSAPGAASVMTGVILALVLGKPFGIFLASWASVKTGLCRLPSGATWGGVLLVGLLGGIGFTMSIFVTNLAYTDASLTGAAKLGVLIASTFAAVIGTLYGLAYLRRHRANIYGGP